MQSISIFALICLISISTSYSQAPLLLSTKNLFTQEYPNLEPHQLFFLSRPSTQKLHSQKLLLADSFQTCVILTIDHKKHLTDCRYFIKEDQIEISTEKERRILQANQIFAISIAEKIFVPKSYVFDQKVFFGYFQLLEEGKYCLYKKFSSKIKKPSQLIKEYYYQKPLDKFPIKLSLKKKNIAACFEEKTKWQSYHSKTKPSLKKEIDLIKTFRYFNQIAVED